MYMFAPMINYASSLCLANLSGSSLSPISSLVNNCPSEKRRAPQVPMVSVCDEKHIKGQSLNGKWWFNDGLLVI